MQTTHATTLIQPADRQLQAINPDPRLDDPAIRLKHAIDFDPDDDQAAAIINKVGSPDQSLRSVSLYFGITLEALTLWLDRPEITRRLDAIRTCQLRRARLAAANYLPTLIPVLSDLINASAYDDRAPIPCTDLKGREFLRRSRNTSLKAIHLITKIAQTPIRAIGSPHVSKGFDSQPRVPDTSTRPASQPRAANTSTAPPHTDARVASAQSPPPTSPSPPHPLTSSPPHPCTSPPAHPLTCSAPQPLTCSASPPLTHSPTSPPTRPPDHSPTRPLSSERRSPKRAPPPERRDPSCETHSAKPSPCIRLLDWARRSVTRLRGQNGRPTLLHIPSRLVLPACAVLGAIAAAACAQHGTRKPASTSVDHSGPTEARSLQPHSPTVLPTLHGDPVDALNPCVLIVYLAKDGVLWFGSDGHGVYRSDGTSLTRFTTKHGLGGDHVRGIQEDRAGNILVQSDPGGISRFDGRAFSTLAAVNADPATGQWRLHPDDLWFSGGQDSGIVYRYDGTTHHRLAFPKTEPGEAHIAQFPRSEFPAMKFNPYDVYTIRRDSKGHLWFGTGCLGVCRYDGTSFEWADKVEVGLGVNDSFGVRSIFEDNDGRFWFSNTRDRFLVQRDAAPSEDDLITRPLRFTKEPGAAALINSVPLFMSSLKDDKGDFWLATYADVWRFDGKTLTEIPIEASKEPKFLLSMTQDRRGGVWLGTKAHGVYRFSGASFEKFTPKSRARQP